MRRTILGRGALSAIAVLLAAPAGALAQDGPALEQLVSEVNVTWVLVGTALVFFMQAGFALLEIGFSRGKNAGMGIAKILVNFSVASIAWWGAGFAIAFGGAGVIAGDAGFFPSFGNSIGGLAGDLYGDTFNGSTAADR